MNSRIVVGMFAGLLLVTAHPSLAAESGGRSFKWMGEMSYSSGGERLLSVEYTDGSTENFDAGDGFTFSGGILQHINDSFGIKYALGFKFNESRDDAISVRSKTFPIDVVPYYVNGNHRIGVGITHHLSPELDDEQFGTFEFDDATGLVAEYSYSMFTVAYTSMDYSIVGADIDASHFSIRFTGAF